MSAEFNNLGKDLQEYLETPEFRETKRILDYVESLNKVSPPVQYESLNSSAYEIRSELTALPQSLHQAPEIVASVAIAVAEKKGGAEDKKTENTGTPSPQNSPVMKFLTKAGNALAEVHDNFCYELSNIAESGLPGYVSSLLMGGIALGNFNALQYAAAGDGFKHLLTAGILGYTAFNTIYHIINGKVSELRGVTREARVKGKPNFVLKGTTFALLAIQLLSHTDQDVPNNGVIYAQSDNSNRIDSRASFASQGFFVEGTGDYAGMTFVYTPEEIRNVENLNGVVEAALDNVFSGYDHPEIQNENIRQMIADFGYDPVVLVKSLLLQESRALDVDNPPSYGPMQVNLAVAGRPSVSEFENFTLQQKIEAGLKVVVDSILYHKDHGQDVWLQQYNQIHYENGVPNYNRKPYANLIKSIYNNLLARET